MQLEAELREARSSQPAQASGGSRWPIEAVRRAQLPCHLNGTPGPQGHPRRAGVGEGHSSIGHMLAAACELELRQDTLAHATSTASSNCCQQSFRLTGVATDVLLCAQRTTCSSGLTRRWRRPTRRRRRTCRTCWPAWARRSAKLTGALDCVYHNCIGWSGCCCKLLGVVARRHWLASGVRGEDWHGAASYSHRSLRVRS